MSDPRADKVYLKLKEALALCETQTDRDAVQGCITNIRHECAWADADSPLVPAPDGVSSITASLEDPAL
ncbi:MAG: hypothetical protein LCH74_03635 [Proteobacteria bacterium]|nr:hypothetical protein [Pseudomonadota bacterium]